jgi:Tol biopolymer transport system component
MFEIGQSVSHYKILDKLGAGGMGEVYRAQDTNLNRQVAIKALPDLFSGDPERLARFEREAQLLASLNHPSIAIIFGMERVERELFLVMELVEGQTLAQRLEQGPLPVEEALEIGRRIAEGLEAAHEKGIIHRDLKPANIKIAPEGNVKILDFGLAKALTGEAEAANATQSPTVTEAMTRHGVILGTAAYMSPEQARGKPVDKRTDIWAFACVLYELLAGHRAFAGDDVTDLIVAVMTKEPDWALLPPATPRRIVELLRRCLKKDRRARLHDIADARLEIEDAIARGSLDAGADESPAAPALIAGATRRQKLAWAMLGAALAAVVAVGLVLSGVWPRVRLPGTRPLRVSIVHTEGDEVGAPAISPDGTRVAYAARRADGMPVLWVRDLASGEARPLAGTEGASMPFWSPDSHDLGFDGGSYLKRVPADGGPVQVVSEKSSMRGGTWAPDETIIFCPGDTGPLFRVSAAPRGTATPLTKLQGNDWSHLWPSFLPDGRRFLFTAKLWTRAAEASEQGIYLGSLDSPEKIHRLLPDLSSAVYAPPGYLVFVRGGTLTAASFDLATGRVGQPVPIGGTVAVDHLVYFSGVSAAADGTLAVRPPPAAALIGSVAGGSNAELRLVDRAGTGNLVGAAQSFAFYMALSPDGRLVAAEIDDPRAGTSDLWLVDLKSGNQTPLTATHGWTGVPVWSADGTRLGPMRTSLPVRRMTCTSRICAPGGSSPLSRPRRCSSTPPPGPTTAHTCSSG